MSRPTPEKTRGQNRGQIPGLAARLAAVGQVGDVLDRRLMLDESRLALTPAERAEASSLADLTLRRLGQIDALIGHFVPRMPKPPVNHVLRVMTAELIHAGTAPHAAVDMAVRAVKQAGAPKMAGLINAVGHKLSREGADLAIGLDPALNMPDWLTKRLTRDWGRETTQAIALAHLQPAPHDLTLRGAPVDGLEATALPNGSQRLTARPQISALPGFAEGAWWAQDAAASLPAMLLGPVAGRRALDLCAAPGGKTLQLAAMGAKVTALDISEKRLKRLHENLARMGLGAEIAVADARKWTPEATFDAILLDAPCSATGTIRRHPDLPHRFRDGDLQKLYQLQSDLLDRAFQWLAPGGRLVYCTCSLLKSEGEGQIRRALDRISDARTDDAIGETGLQAAFRGLDWSPETATLRTRPDHWAEQGHLDGFFAARLRRRD
ncbi:MAG: transcription antitermination factor NusB [Pseudomonadota bacterium]